MHPDRAEVEARAAERALQQRRQIQRRLAELLRAELSDGSGKLGPWRGSS